VAEAERKPGARNKFNEQGFGLKEFAAEEE